MTDEVKDLVKQVNEGLTAIKSEVAGVKASQADTAEMKTKLEKMSEQVLKAGEQLQEFNQKQTALEAALNRFDERNDGKKADPEKVKESKSAFREYLRGGEAAIKGGKFKHTAEGLEIRSMATDNNPDGGYLVLPEMADFMVTRLFETSPMRSLARVVQTGSKSLQVVIDDNEAEANWVGEGTSGGETDTPQVGLLEIVAHKLEAEPKVTTEMLEDPFVDVESWLQGKIADKFSRKQNTAFVSGSGILQPKGFLSYSAWSVAGTYERNKIEQINAGASGAVTAEGLIALQAGLKEVYQTGATWLMKRASYGSVLSLKGADNYFFGTMLLKDGNTQLQLLGKPVVFADDMAAIGNNTLSFAYGDFSVGYTILDRVGLNILRDPYTSKGFVKYYATIRSGGDVTNYEAIKIGKIPS